MRNSSSGSPDEFGGLKAQAAVKASPATPLFAQAILNGATNALSTSAHLDAAEQAAVTGLSEGVAVASDPATYTAGLIDAIGTLPAGKVSPTAAMLAEMAVETASATYVAAHPAPATLLAPTALATLAPTA